MTALSELLATTSLTNRYVPNQFPTLNTGVPYRIALIGEAPGGDEVIAGKPFVGASGRWLDYLLNRVGILRSTCFLGNVCQVRPPNNKIELFSWNGDEIQHGLHALQNDLDTFGPNLCVLLGGSALRAAKGYPESITKWRGSLFAAGNGTPMQLRKCLATFHPASSLRVYEQTPLLLLDLKRARQQGEEQELRIPHRNIRVLRSLGDVQIELQRLRNNKQKLGTDIEGYVNNLTCISFSDDPLCGYVIPFVGPNGNFWRPDEELVVWNELRDLLEDPTVPKTLQNGLYDRFVLAYTYGIMVRGVTDDTMLKHWECYCELEKRLSLQASIYTLEPYYKDERTTDDWEEFWQYSGKDSCVTLEIDQHLETAPELKGRSREHYRFNVRMQDPLLYMEMRGMNYDQTKAKQTAQEIRAEVYLLQDQVNRAAGRGLSIQIPQQALDVVVQSICVKRAHPTSFEDLRVYCKKPYEDVVERIIELCKGSYPFDAARNGELSSLLDLHLNTDSSVQMQAFLYTVLGLPVQTNKKTKQPTTDALALLKLFKRTEKEGRHVVADTLKAILKLSSKLTQLQTLEILCDPDRRIRCSYNVVGTETGRLSCSKSPTRSGYNLQTVTKKQRGLFLPDPGHYLFQCDLSGADGWTVAAHCKRLGDPTMFNDLQFGLKPAKIIARMYEGVNVAVLTREQIKVECEKVDPDGWLYMACKRVYHGTDYMMGKLTMSDQILEDSWKYGEEPVYVPPNVCEDLQILTLQRYIGIRVWQRWVQEQLKNHRQLTSANGHTRRFTGRPNDHGTWKQALADEPQNVTTYVTKLALEKMWIDPTNQEPDGSLIVEPLHTVHDSLVGQFPIDLVDWSLPKIRTYFDNQIVIAGERLVIPFEGAYGTSWHPKDLKFKI
jgi:uracil-DNA glycosylase family 4